MQVGPTIFFEFFKNRAELLLTAFAKQNDNLSWDNRYLIDNYLLLLTRNTIIKFILDSNDSKYATRIDPENANYRIFHRKKNVLTL